MAKKTAALRQRRAADTARWRERLHRGAVQKHIGIAEPSKNLSSRGWRTTQALARAWPAFSSISVAHRPCGQFGTVRRCTPAGAQSRRRSALEDPQTSGGG
jgi:hypothetical protein